MLSALCDPSWAQQPAKIHRIGILTGASESSEFARTEAFRQGLRELGYVEGENISIEYRYAEGKLDRLSSLAVELVHLKVDVLVTAGPLPTRGAKEATSTIPIVMAQDPDPIGNAFVANLARPNGNITGLSAVAPELSGKRVELLKEMLPALSRVAVFGTSTYPGNAQATKEIDFAAKAFGVTLQHLDVLDSKGIEAAFHAARTGPSDAGIWLVAGGVANTQRKQVTELAVKNRLAVTYSRPEFINAGGLVYYGTNYNDLYRRAATYVDKILKGAKPADLPVEQPTKFELIINLKAAKQIGLTIPPNVLARADRVIR
jgi:putative ABC transport system substrate-binding protein